MGEFVQDVKRGTISGPNRPGFDRQRWEHQAADSSGDAEDRRIASTGLIFDELLRAIRGRKVRDMDLPRELSVRVAVGVVNHAHLMISMDSLANAIPQDSTTITTADILQSFVETPTGQIYHVDEIYTGMGDGLRYLLGDMFSGTASPSSRTEVAIRDVETVTEELKS